MSCIISLFISFSLLLLITPSYTQRDKLFFRKDYTYLEETRGFYKIHTLPRSFDDAYDICEAEGAAMFYPEDETEANVVVEFWKRTNHNVGYAYVGITSSIVQGAFETIDGQPLLEVYHKWGPGEPNNGLGGKPENCVELLSNAVTLNDVDCDGKRPFLCRKTLSTLEWNQLCDLPNMDYKFEKYMGKCYKLHKEPKTWQEAYYTCHAEQSYLAVINSDKEAKILVKIVAGEEDQAEKLKDVELIGAPSDNAKAPLLAEEVHVGFSKRPRGWKTVKGTKLEDNGYTEWEDHHPESAAANKTCGAMSGSGKLTDVKCTTKSAFICEHDVIACDLCSAKK